jgi:hypothetical protein
MDNLGCVKVRFGPDSAFFDSNSPWYGAPRAISDLLVDTNRGEKLTIVGRVESWAKTDNDNDKPAEYYPLLQLEALVAELGEFLQVEGTVAEDAIEAGFPMTVSSGGPLIISDTLDVMYQLGDTGINGTRIVSKSGKLLGPLDVKKFLPVQVDGTDGGSMLKAALVILDKAALGTEQVTGVIESVDTDSLLLALDPDVSTVCGVTDSMLEVALTNNLEVFTVTITSDSSLIEPGGTLKANQTVGMNGICEGIDYKTDNVVIVDDQRS